jgi:hypothetical protein
MLWRQGSLVISPMPRVLLLCPKIISLVVREGFERVPTLVEHPNGGVQISLHAVSHLALHKGQGREGYLILIRAKYYSDCDLCKLNVFRELV